MRNITNTMLAGIALMVVLMASGCTNDDGGVAQVPVHTSTPVPSETRSSEAVSITTPTTSTSPADPVTSEPLTSTSPTESAVTTEPATGEPETATSTSVTEPSPVPASSASTETSFPGASRAPLPVVIMSEDDCPLDQADINDTLAGGWTVEPDSDTLFCTYTSERGAVMIAVVIEAPADEIDMELRVARDACTGPATDVGGDPVAFYCLEGDDTFMTAAGSVLTRGRLWLMNIALQDPEGDGADELAAMAALVETSLTHQ